MLPTIAERRRAVAGRGTSIVPVVAAVGVDRAGR